VVFTVGDQLRKDKIENQEIKMKALTSIVSVCLSIIQFTECHVGKIFEKIEMVKMMRHMFSSKSRQIMNAQLVKLVMGRLEDKDKRDQKDKDPDLINEIRKHDLLGSLIEVFIREYRSNNILISTILECLKTITALKFKDFYGSILAHQDELRRHANIPVIGELLAHVAEH
jgi:hypothetical protein